jgi:hypothetical protein
MSHAYFIEYATRETTVEHVREAFNREFDGDFVSRIDESITQDYKASWKAFTIHFHDSCVDDLFSENTLFIGNTDDYKLYYTATDYWTVHLIKV